MNKLKKLIVTYCPDGVKYMPVGSVSQTVSPVKKIKLQDYADSGKYPIIDQGQDFIGGYTDEDVAFPNSEYVIFGDHTCVTKYVDFPFVQGADGLKVIEATKNIIPKFLYYAISNIKMKVEYKRHWTKMRTKLIPIPPLEVQKEIVRILDNFTELMAELTAELVARKQQCEYYQDYLSVFNYDAGIKEVALGDIATVTKLAGFEFTKYVVYSDVGEIIALRGLNVKNGSLDLTDVKYLDNSDFTKLTRSKLRVGDILFTYVGTIGQVALIDEDDKYYLGPNVALIRLNTSEILPEFLKVYFQGTYFWNTQINRLLQSSSLKNLPMEKIRKFKIKVPPIKLQRKIIDAAYHFNAICFDQCIGIPAEIEARKKQYEYYRDKLLTFKEKRK